MTEPVKRSRGRPSKPALPLAPDDIAFYRSGASIPMLGRRLGHGSDMTKKRLLASGVAIRPRGSRKERCVPTAPAIALYRQGKTLQYIAELYKCGPEWVRQVLKQAGVERRRVGRPKAP